MIPILCNFVFKFFFSFLLIVIHIWIKFFSFILQILWNLTLIFRFLSINEWSREILCLQMILILILIGNLRKIQRFSARSFDWWGSNQAASSIAFRWQVCDPFICNATIQHIILIFFITEFFIFFNSCLLWLNSVFHSFALWGLITHLTGSALVMLWLVAELRWRFCILKILIS